MAGFVLLRARAHRLLLGAVLLTVVLTAAVLTTLTAFSTGVLDAAVRHNLRGQDASAAGLAVSGGVAPGDRAATTRALEKAAARAFDGLPVQLRTLVRSGPYALPGTGRTGTPDLTYAAALDPAQTRLTEGRRPRAGGGQGIVEAALPEAAARALRLAPGARLTLTDRLDGPPVRVLITGVYRPARPDAPYWQLDDLRGRGVQQSSFTTYGPLLTDPAALADGRLSRGDTGWLATADFSALGTAGIPALRASMGHEVATLTRDGVRGTDIDARSGLPGVLDRAERAVAVARSVLLIAALLLAVLAGYALLLVASLLGAERSGEVRLLRARGAAGRRIALLAGAEALFVALPAAVCAPPLALALSRLLTGHGELARIGLGASASGPGRWLVGALVALGCAAVVTLPALVTADGARGRARALPSPLRAGADVGLLVVAGVAYGQLRRQGAGSGLVGSGTPAVDPLLVAAPALVLLAVTVPALRLLPLLVRIAERRAAGGRGLTGALAGWQLGRRALRGAGPALLVVLAVATGVLAVGQGASWQRSQRDQADFRAGTEVRVMTPGGSGPGQSGVFAAVPGVRDAAPAVRTALPLSDDRVATVLALDTGHADGLRLRGDLSTGSPLAALAPRGTLQGARLPTGVRRVELGVRARLAPASGTAAPGTARDGSARRGTGSGHDAYGQVVSAEPTLTVLDRYGTPYRMPLPALPVDGRTHRLALDLGAAGRAGASAAAFRPAEPLTLAGLGLSLPQPVGAARRVELALTPAVAGTADGGRHEMALTGAWRATADVDRPDVEPASGPPPTAPAPRPAARGLRAVYTTGYAPPDVVRHGVIPRLTLRLTAGPAAPDAGIPAVATDRFLTSAGARVGQRVDVPLDSGSVRVRIVKAVRRMPTTGPGAAEDPAAPGQGSVDGGALLLDLRTLNRTLTGQDAAGVAPTEWWLATERGGAARAVGALRARPDIDPARVLARSEIAARLRDDPLGAGPQAAFTAVAVAAALIAAVGFAVSAAGALRARRDEFAVLRALGARRATLRRTIATEYTVLLAFALLTGLILGVLLAYAVVPLMVRTPAGAAPVPTVLVSLPGGPLALLAAAVAAVPVVVITLLARRHAAPETTLRGPEDTWHG